MGIYQRNWRKKPPKFAAPDSPWTGHGGHQEVSTLCVRLPATRSQKASEDMGYNMIRDPQTFLDEIERRSEHM